MAKPRDPKHARASKGGTGWRILPFKDEDAAAPADGPPLNEDAALAEMQEFVTANPGLFAEAMGALEEIAGAFAKKHGRRPTEAEVIELVGLGELDSDQLEGLAAELDASGAFTDFLEDIDDDDLEPFPDDGADKGGGGDGDAKDKR